MILPQPTEVMAGRNARVTCAGPSRLTPSTSFHIDLGHLEERFIPGDAAQFTTMVAGPRSEMSFSAMMLTLLFAGDIHLVSAGLDALGGNQSTDFLGAGLVGVVGNRHIGPCGGEFDGDRAADPTGSAGDEGKLSF